MTPAVAVSADPLSLIERAAVLAQTLALPLSLNPEDQHFSFVLVLTPQRLELRQQGRHAPGPVYVDFLSAALQQRRRSGRHQPLARAIGCKAKQRPRVLDATAGFARDAFVLACLGCQVDLVERSPIMAALLQHGLEQAAADEKIGAWVRERLHLITADAKTIIEQRRYPVIYLDPMYPHRSKSALVKKEMRALRQIVGDDNDAPALLSIALQHADKRVVVKRPRLAPSLEGPSPSTCIPAGQVRFDVYMMTGHEPSQ